MAKFLLFVVSVTLSLFLLFEGGVFFGAHKASDRTVQNIRQDAPFEGAKTAPRASSTTTIPGKITPIAAVPAKKIVPISPKKIAPKVASPLVHYTEKKPTPNTLASVGVVVWTNTYREQNNLKSLQKNSQLDAAAIIKVHDMFDRQYFEHVSPTGKNSSDLVSGVGYDYLWVGENLALGIFSDEKDLVDAWMASPGHRANILNPHFEEIGVGVDEGMFEGKHVWIAVQEFGKPASSCPAPEKSIKAGIEENKKRIDELSEKVNGLLSEINALKEGSDADTYNQKVSKYNALVAQLNPLIQETKSLIEVYNGEINAYNACIGG